MHTTQATTDCYQTKFEFQELGGRRVEADFSGGHLSSDGGSLLLREVDRAHRLCDKLAACFSDLRNRRFVEHELAVMLRQRVLGLALGYEDINDHDKLRLDPLLPGTARTFMEMRYQTLKSWSRERRVIGKAELLEGKANPRYIVTSLTGTEAWAQGHAWFVDAASLYEQCYCARGDMENRQQMDLFADRTSTAHMKSNQLRLWLSTFGYLLMRHLRAGALAGTRLAKASTGTLRLHLLKVAAQVSVSVRRVHVRLCSAFPLQEVFAQAHRALRQAEE